MRNKVTQLSRTPAKSSKKKLPPKQTPKPSINKKSITRQSTTTDLLQNQKQQEVQFGKSTINNQNLTLSKFVELSQQQKTLEIGKIVFNQQKTVNKEQKKQNVKLDQKKSCNSLKAKSPNKNSRNPQDKKSQQKNQLEVDLPSIIQKTLKIQSVKSDSLVASFCSLDNSIIRKLPPHEHCNSKNQQTENEFQEKNELQELQKTQLQLISTILKKNKQEIDNEFKVKIQELEQEISTLKYELESRNIILNQLNASKNSQGVEDLKQKKQSLEYKITNLVMERDYLYTELSEVTEKLEKYERELSKYRQRQIQDPQDKQTETMIQKLNIQLEEQKFQNEVLNKLATSHQNQILILRQQNNNLKNQLKLISSNKPIYIQEIIRSKPEQIELNPESIVISKIKLHSSTVKLNVNEDFAQGQKITLSSLTYFNGGLLDSNARKRVKKQITLQQYVAKYSDNNYAKFTLAIKLLNFFLKNEEKNICLFYDPKQIIIKGQSKFLQILSNRSPIRTTEHCFLAPQFLAYIPNDNNLLIDSKQGSIWNCALLIDYILNGERYFKKCCELQKFEDSYQIKNPKYAGFENILRSMIRKKPDQRIFLAKVESKFNSIVEQFLKNEEKQ